MDQTIIDQTIMPGSVTRRRVLAAAAAAPLALNSRAQNARGGNAKPNIVFILADDMGYADLSCYGRREYSTPNIDGIGARGVRFLQAYANSAVCSATRTALITGRYQYRLRVGLEEPLGNGAMLGLPPEHPTLPSLLKKAGYSSTLIGKWHLGGLPNFGPLKSGYDHFWGFRGGGLDYFSHTFGPDQLWEDDVKIDQAGYLTDLLGDRAVKVIADYGKARQSFLLSLHFNAPHWPWEGPTDEAESRRLAGNIMDRDGGTQKIYAAMVTDLDRQVGRVLQALTDAGVADNTIVIFTSDNGGERFSDTWPFTGKKTELLEGGLRIPALVRWPARIRAGGTTEQVAISMDWFATLLAAAGAAPDPAYPPDGVNLLPVVTQGSAPVARKLYWRYHYNAQRAMRDGDMKYLRIAGNEFLFNVAEDPLERANLKRRQAEVFERMTKDYEAWDATMLLDINGVNTSPIGYADELADHYGVTRPAGRGAPPR